MQQHAELESGGKRTGALLLPAQHAAPRNLDHKVEDPHEKDVVDSAASPRDEHQRVNYEKDCSGVEHGDHNMNITAASRKSDTKSSNMGKRAWHEDAIGSRDDHTKKYQHKEEVRHGCARHSARPRIGHTRHIAATGAPCC